MGDTPQSRDLTSLVPAGGRTGVRLRELPKLDIRCADVPSAWWNRLLAGGLARAVRITLRATHTPQPALRVSEPGEPGDVVEVFVAVFMDLATTAHIDLR